MYKNYPNSAMGGTFFKKDIEKGIIAVHTDYKCPFCGCVQSVSQMGGYGGDCIKCGKSSNPLVVHERLRLNPLVPFQER